ncbi:MAG TPA: hypothetical protein VKE26_12280 [Xanthobacteraceae bacterium]|nr:hypothetical protein [Xanthobacteraceae bacterium]
MPICEADPWRLQYFRDADCPPHVKVPTEDFDAWAWYPRHRWVYDKIAVAHSQGLDAGPHGTTPPCFPVFSKPIINLKGMGIGSRFIRSAKDYEHHYCAGHMWMTLLEGRHVSSDVAVVRGAPRWWRHATAKPGRNGTFDFWTVHAAAEPDIEQRCGAWIRRHLADYTGMLNLETIGGTIIEVHLRLSDQWPDLYGAGWVDALVRLYHCGTWQFCDHVRRDGFSVVLFGRKGRRYRHPPAAAVQEILRRPDVSSVQITFREDLAPAYHAMPPGGFRLAIVNCWDLQAGIAARGDLQAHFAVPVSRAATSKSE